MLHLNYLKLSNAGVSYNTRLVSFWINAWWDLVRDHKNYIFLYPAHNFLPRNGTEQFGPKIQKRGPTFLQNTLIHKIWPTTMYVQCTRDFLLQQQIHASMKRELQKYEKGNQKVWKRKSKSMKREIKNYEKGNQKDKKGKSKR